MTASSAVGFLDQSATFWGSGFLPYEPLRVFINLRDDGTVSGTVQAHLGFADANGGGAWSFTIEEDTLGEVSVVSSNSAAFIEAGIVSVVGEGLDGSLASVPIAIRAKTPLPPVAPDPPSVASSLLVGTMTDSGQFVAGVVAEGGTMRILGAGFSPNEATAVTVITGVGVASEYSEGGEVMTTGLSAAPANDKGAFLRDVEVSMEPGVYTIEARGVSGTYATAVLWITAKE